MAPLGLEQLQRVAEYELGLARIALTHKSCPNSWIPLLHSAISPLPSAGADSLMGDSLAGDVEVADAMETTTEGGHNARAETIRLVFEGFDAIKALYVERAPSAFGLGIPFADRTIADGRQFLHCLYTQLFTQSQLKTYHGRKHLKQSLMPPPR